MGRTGRSSRSPSGSTTPSSRISTTAWTGPASRIRSGTPGGSTEFPSDYVGQLVEYWRHAYDWRAEEEQLNQLPHYRTTIDGQAIHFIHARSPHPDALPLLITHGWPGSVVEFLDVIPRLTDPVAHGGRVGRRLPCDRALAPGLRLLRTAPDPGMGRPADRPGIRRAHGSTRLRPLRRPGRRLGGPGDDADRGTRCGALRRRPPQHGPRARPPTPPGRSPPRSSRTWRP